jgi:hypothetical protein
MKTITLLFAAAFVLVSSANAADAPKPLLQLSAKKQVLDTEHDKHGAGGSSKEKTLALRVVIFNTGATTVGESVLTGTALVSRSGEFRDQVVKESLGEIKVPELKPNEKVTLDLGKIELRELEWNKRKFEEELEEWQVTCKQGGVEIGKAESSANYALLAKDAASSDSPKPHDANPGRRKFPKR